MTTTQSTVRKLELRNAANVDRQVLIITSHLMYRRIDGYHCCYTIYKSTDAQNNDTNKNVATALPCLSSLSPLL